MAQTGAYWSAPQRARLIPLLSHPCTLSASLAVRLYCLRFAFAFAFAHDLEMELQGPQVFLVARETKRVGVALCDRLETSKRHC